MNCKVMGIVNVTPDSFSDGGKYFSAEEAIRRARNLVSDGADIIDIGGESTRPDATPIGWEEEWARISPILLALAGSVPTMSVDTYHPETAERAIAVGATMINCVYAEPAKEMLHFLKDNRIELVVPAEISGVCPQKNGRVDERIWIDPMIGFGTTREEDIERLKSIGELAKKGRVLVGASRKRIVKKLVGTKTAGKDVAGNLAIALYAASAGASGVRVHDVKETVQALRVWNSLQ